MLGDFLHRYVFINLDIYKIIIFYLNRNINEFCHVLKQLPSLEEKKPSTKSPNILNGSIAKSRESRNKNGLAPKPTDGPIVTEELRKVLLALSSNQANHKVISPGNFYQFHQNENSDFTNLALKMHDELIWNLKLICIFIYRSPVSCHLESGASFSRLSTTRRS